MKLYYEKSELPDLVSLSESTIDEEIRNGTFPKPRQLSKKRVGYFWDDILEWARTRPKAVQLPPPNTGAKKARSVSGAAALAAPAAHQGA